MKNLYLPFTFSEAKAVEFILSKKSDNKYAQIFVEVIQSQPGLKTDLKYNISSRGTVGYFEVFHNLSTEDQIGLILAFNKAVADLTYIFEVSGTNFIGTFLDPEGRELLDSIRQNFRNL